MSVLDDRLDSARLAFLGHKATCNTHQTATLSRMCYSGMVLFRALLQREHEYISKHRNLAAARSAMADKRRERALVNAPSHH